jgi:hypothetical protein
LAFPYKPLLNNDYYIFSGLRRHPAGFPTEAFKGNLAAAMFAQADGLQNFCPFA